MIQNWLTQEEFDAEMLAYERIRNEKETDHGFRVMDGADVIQSLEYLLDSRMSELLSNAEIELVECRIRRFPGVSSGDEYMAAKTSAGINEGDTLPWAPDVLRAKFKEMNGEVE